MLAQGFITDSGGRIMNFQNVQVQARNVFKTKKYFQG
jgi:hypothetical protein